MVAARFHTLLIVLFLCMAVQSTYACDCGEQMPVFSKAETEKYGLIFIGKIDSITHKKNNGSAWFKGLKLYKGIATPVVEIRFDNYSSCQMPFQSGDLWMIYAVKDSVTYKWITSYCSRSRKYPAQDELDEYTVYSNITFEKEEQLLAEIYPLKDFVESDIISEIDEKNKTVIDANRNLMHADNMQKIILLAISLAGVILIYIVVKKLLR